ncbi:MAG: methyltransferase domain-containing protein [Lachnospiraceae bacterium]|nr:methyltransferase domain-containing protein [Lachnospiraceae bacterium]
MSAYNEFALVYDLFMDNVPYEKWAKDIVRRLKEKGINQGIVAELGCGTGKMTRLLAKEGYDMIGIDSSYEMLMEARNNTEDEGILYLCQDMREFELYGTVESVVSVCDCMNYLLTKEDLSTVFKLAENYLEYGGPFIFDMITPYRYREIMADNTFAENRDEGSFIWENYYDEDTKTNQYDLTLYIKDEDESYQRFEEQHIQHAFEIEEVVDLLKKAKFENIEVFDEATGESVSNMTQRAVFVAYKRGQ